MNKYLSVILLSFLIFSSCENKTIIQTELDFLDIKPKNFKSIDTTFYEDKKIKSLRFINGKTEYIYVFFYESGKKKSINPVKNNQCHNKYIDWYENGKVKWTREYNYGIQIGKSTQYQENGNLEQQFDNENKESTSYWENGKPKSKFKKDVLQYYFYSNGNLIEKYDKIKKNEYFVRYYSENGEMKFSGNYKFNILYKDDKKYNGKIICYFNNGKISHFEDVVNGIPKGKFYKYYGNGILKFESEVQDEKEIYFKCYYENGKVDFIRDGIKNTFTKWNEKGELEEKKSLGH